MAEPTGQDQLDFRNARARSLMRSIWALISGRDTALMAWDEVRDKLKLRGLIYRGVQTVPLEKIIGSVGRYRDFDDEFMPTQNQSADRWRKVNRAFYEDISLPPVQLYKVGEVYFVLDGNHRVSVAHEHGATYIDAEVQEAVTRVNLTEQDIDANNLEMLGEYGEFLQRTKLDRLRPEQNLRFSIGGAYARLLEHIAVHRYYMGLEQKRDIGEDEAVRDWYDNVYLPIVKAVREDKILEDFPGRTESDLYLWMIDHQHYLREQCEDCGVDAEKAVTDYVDKFGEKPVLKRVVDAVGEFIESL
jgi:Domain of unknown function (DUF4032)